MNQNIIWVIVLAVIVAGAYLLSFVFPMRLSTVSSSTPTIAVPKGTTSGRTTQSTSKTATSKTSTNSPLGVDFRNAAYSINGTSVHLVNGVAVTASAPGSASKTITQVFGNEATGDLNADGLPDVAFILTQDTGGSGTFYYVAVALKTLNGYRGTNALYIGDRIAPQPTNISGGEVIVNYADRAPGEPMSAKPSIGKSKYFEISKGVLVAM